MLYRQTGRCVVHQQGGPIVIERTSSAPPRNPARFARALRQPIARSSRSPRCDQPCVAPEIAQAMRPRPGIDSRLWDHDLVALFTNVYRLGHASEFSLVRLLRELDSE